MIELYRPADCAECEEYEAALREMVIAHKVIAVKSDAWPDSLPAQTPLPALKDGQEVVTGPEAIHSHLEMLARFMQDWQRFQGDYCYTNSDGTNC
jgi:hypothetical protein